MATITNSFDPNFTMQAKQTSERNLQIFLKRDGLDQDSVKAAIENANKLAERQPAAEFNATAIEKGDRFTFPTTLTGDQFVAGLVNDYFIMNGEPRVSVGIPLQTVAGETRTLRMTSLFNSVKTPAGENIKTSLPEDLKKALTDPSITNQDQQYRALAGWLAGKTIEFDAQGYDNAGAKPTPSGAFAKRTIYSISVVL